MCELYAHAFGGKGCYSIDREKLSFREKTDESSQRSHQGLEPRRLTLSPHDTISNVISQFLEGRLLCELSLINSSALLFKSLWGTTF